MKTSTLVTIVIGVLILLGGWYLLGNNTATETPSDTAGLNDSQNQGNLGEQDTGTVQQPMEDGAEGSVIGDNLALGTNGNATLGTYLIAYNGMTLYTTSKDTGTASTCYDTCASNWPPYIVGPEDNLTQLKAGVTGKVGTTIRTDGKIQVTYNGHPLYFYTKDTKSGDTTGQNVGGVWFVVKP